MLKYVLKRIGLMFLTLFIIFVICFVFIRLLEPPTALYGNEKAREEALRAALGYDKPIIVQLLIYLKNIFLHWDWGYSWKIDYLTPVTQSISSRLAPTILINVYSLIFSVPLGIGLGIFAALKKNRWQDHLISTLIMIFVSVPSYVYAFLVQYFLGFKLGLFDLTILSIDSAGSWGWFSPSMTWSMALPVLALSFGTIAGLARFTRAELTEVLTSEFMLLARTKGLTKRKAVTRHALNNAMVPILPSIISMFVGVLSGSLIIEAIFGVPGIGALYIKSIQQLDLDLFMGITMFYTIIGLSSTILIDLSYGFIDPRIRMGAKK